MITAFPTSDIVAGPPDIAHDGREPQRGHAEIVEITRLQCHLQPSQIATEIAGDIFLFGIVKRRIASRRRVVSRVSVAEAVGHCEVNHVITPRPGVDPHGQRPSKEKGFQKHTFLCLSVAEGWSISNAFPRNREFCPTAQI